MVTIQTRLKYAGVKDKAPVIDVSRAGYCKVDILNFFTQTHCTAPTWVPIWGPGSP